MDMAVNNQPAVALRVTAGGIESKRLLSKV
jgi:hypothetical protein